MDSATIQRRQDRLGSLIEGCTSAEALDFFDTLPPLSPREALGLWRGDDLPTGHPADGLLGPLGWFGKQCDSPEQVHPLVFHSDTGLFAVDPAGIPVSWLPKAPAIRVDGGVAEAVRRLLPLRRTTIAKARLRPVEYRGVTSTAIIYDALPVIDHLRAVDADTLLGAMDARGVAQPFFFVLRRSDDAPL